MLVGPSWAGLWHRGSQIVPNGTDGLNQPYRIRILVASSTRTTIWASPCPKAPCQQRRSCDSHMDQQICTVPGYIYSS